jgi:hypothetical protein
VESRRSSLTVLWWLAMLYWSLAAEAGGIQLKSTGVQQAA